MDENSPEAQFNRMMEQVQDNQQRAFNAQLQQQRQLMNMNGQASEGGQTSQPQTGPAPSPPLPGQNPNLSFQEQRVLNELTAKVNTTPPPAVSTAQPSCPDCGLIHPPLQPGQKCPTSQTKVKDGEKTFDTNKYLIMWRDIILSNIDKKKLKKPEELFKAATIELTKFVEGYKE